MAAELYGTADLGTGDLTSAGYSDLLIVSWATDGTLRCARTFGGARSEATGIFVRLPTNETVLVGEMVNALDYGDGEVVGDGHDMFVLRFAAD